MTFSVVIPSYNRHAQLCRCLRALAHQSHDRHDFEIIVVDDGSVEPVVASDGWGAHWRDIKVVRIANGGPAAARNHGARHAIGGYLAFTDDDCEPSEGWLDAMQRAGRERPSHLIGGRTVNALTDDLCATTSQIVVDVAYECYNSPKPTFFASNNMVVPRDAFLALGGFDERFKTAEDRDLCEQWQRAGHGLTYAPDAVVSHTHALTPRAFWRQHFAYGRGAHQFHQKRRQVTGVAFTPDPRFYRMLVARPWRGSWPRALLLEGLIGFQQAANAAGFFSEALSTRFGRH